MRIIYLNSESVYGKINSGSLQCSYSNFNMLKKISGNEFCHIYLDLNNKVYSNARYEFKRAERKMDKFILSLSNRRFLYPKDENKIAKLVIGKKPDIVVYEGPYWNNVIRIVKKRSPGILFITFMQNVEKQYFANLKDKSLGYRLLYKVVKKCEKESVDLADRIICLNWRDGQLLKQTYGREADMYLPINMSDVCKEELIKNSHYNKELLFVGSLFEPNYDGIKWFVEKVMSRLPEYKLTIVGRNFEKVRDELQRDNVCVVGSVDDLSSYYYEYPVMVMPILYGAGMKVKTAEALMYGKTILGTAEAFEGYNINNVRGIFLCQSESDFVDAIKKVYSHPMYLQMQSEVRKTFLEHFETLNLLKDLESKLLQWNGKKI